MEAYNYFSGGKKCYMLYNESVRQFLGKAVEFDPTLAMIFCAPANLYWSLGNIRCQIESHEEYVNLGSTTKNLIVFPNGQTFP